jgi:predicted outer membrane repeat protein
MFNWISSPLLTNVTFSGNSASTGGGIYNWNTSSPTLTNVIFIVNTATNYGGGIDNNNNSDPTLTNVTFSGNSASYGGGMYNYFNSSPTLTNVTFSGNSAATGSGGGMYNDNSNPTLTNVTFSGNSAINGGGMYNWNSNLTLTNVTFSGNSATNGGGLYNANSNPTLTNVILWGDSASSGPEINNSTSNPTISYSDIQGCGGSGVGWQATCGTDGGKNIDADPLFVNAAGGNLRLQSGSPAIDAGNNAAVPVSVTTDLDGSPRFVDIPTVPDTGSGIPPIVDMGAYEVILTTAAFSSAGAQDGWILESTETSNTGGSSNATATTFNLGDDASDRQFRTILSFNTASLPDTATITSVTLQIKRQGIVGTNPFLTHGKILVDIRKGPFGTALLQLTDFNAAASKNNVAQFSNTPLAGNWYSVNLNPTAFAYINKTGITQFRLRFFKDDNDDMGADYLKFFSGNATAAYRPVLIIQYIP